MKKLCPLALLWLAACEPSAPTVSPGYAPVELTPPPAAKPAADPLYDEQGLLRESDRVVAGLRLPRGLEPRHREERRHVFDSEVPLKDLLRYFGPRLVTGEVTPLGEGAVYRNGIPRGVTGGVVRLDVAIRPTKRGAQVEILELPPVPADPPTPGQLAEQLERSALQ